MLKFSAGFTNINPNFVIQNIKACNDTCEPIFSVLNNILQRGCPTIPSRKIWTYQNKTRFSIFIQFL